MQIHGFWHVKDALINLLSRDEVFPRSNLSLSFAGTTLDPLAELQGLKRLKPGAILRLVEEPYTIRAARIHLARVLDLLRAPGPQDALRDGCSPSVNTKTEENNHSGALPEYLHPGSSERPLMIPSIYHWTSPYRNKNFLYITVVTIEGRQCDITSCPKGFFLNRSTEDVFDPRPAQSSPVCHSLSDLLCHISPAFKQTFALKNRPQLSPVETLPTPYHTMSWLGPSCASRIHKNAFTRLGVDDEPATQAPDWNEELQAARDLPVNSLEERLQRDRTLLQVNSAFVRAVRQGAENILDGFVEPVNGNPEDPAFLWGGLFMSQGAAVALLELQGVQAYSNVEGLQGLHTLPTAIVDYRGVRLSAQGLAPGLEASDQDQGASPAGPQESPHRRRLLELLAQACKPLSLQKNVVVKPDGYHVPLFTSIDAQGLLGADGRFYILDVFRTFPADANFCPEAETESQIVSTEEADKKDCTTDGWPDNYHSEYGLPVGFVHKLCRLKPELLQAFIQHKSVPREIKRGISTSLTLNNIYVIAGDSRGTKAVQAACKEVGSVSDIIFEMRFNTNVFSPGVFFPASESKSIKLQQRLLREAAAFIITRQIPLEFCLKSHEAPMDGASLKQALHERGINLRYLGHVVKAIGHSEHKEHLRHIKRVAVGEIFCRSARRVYNNYLQGVDVSSLSAAISHFLCCLLVNHFTPTSVGEDTKKKSRRRGRATGAMENPPWSTLTGSELWNLVCQESVETYNITDALGSGPNYLVEQYGLQKISLLREFCLKTGVQVRLRDYFLDHQNKCPIGPDDILNILPIIKHVSMPTPDASKAYQAAQTSMQKGLLNQALEQLKEAVYLYGRVCDDLQPEACHCHSLLAKATFLQGKAAEACSVQLKAVVISERVLGFDHPNTIQQYSLLGVYAFAGGETVLAQKCFLRARLLTLIVHGEDHPYIATVDSCLGLVLAGDHTGHYLRNALQLHIFSLMCSQHLLAQWMCIRGDYRSAMTHEKEALTVFTILFGEDHSQTQCSTEFLSTITKQAVKVERSLRQAGADCTEQPVEVFQHLNINPTKRCFLLIFMLCCSVDSLQDFKQRHQELKASVAEELGLKLLTSGVMVRSETNPAQEIGCGTDPEDVGSKVESTVKPVNEGCVATVSANGPSEQTQHEDSDRTTSEAVVGTVNGVSEVKPANDVADNTESVEVNGKINGDLNSPPVLKSKGTWADVVSNSVATNSKNKQVITANNTASGAAKD
uniref:Clustered mitochondria protein homolog n=1 Tax=Takifugu rubripes TaxID=31033 RepID=A0A674NJ73_TAKRU